MFILLACEPPLQASVKIDAHARNHDCARAREICLREIKRHDRLISLGGERRQDFGGEATPHVRGTEFRQWPFQQIRTKCNHLSEIYAWAYVGTVVWRRIGRADKSQGDRDR